MLIKKVRPSDQLKRVTRTEVVHLRRQIRSLQQELRSARTDREANRQLAETNLRRCAELQADLDRLRKAVFDAKYPSA